MNVTNIPAELKNWPHWVLWKLGCRKPGDKPTKFPYQADGQMAKANDSSTWSSFEEIVQAYEEGNYSGIGFEFSEADDFCGVDLDGCRNPATGEVQSWAKDIVLKFDSYAEVSPSKTGVKIFCLGKWGEGKKIEVKDAAKVCDKTPGIEVYDRGRYFAVTGLRLVGPKNIEPRQEQLDWLRATYFPDLSPVALASAAPVPDFRSDQAVLERARKYVGRMEPAISGQSGHKQTFHVACVLVLGFELSESQALAILSEYNQACQPPWSEKELIHKVKQASKQPGQRGYLRNVGPARWEKVPVPEYKEDVLPEPRVSTLVKAAREYLGSIASGQNSLMGLGIEELNYAIGGGVEFGELILLVARPSHAKSAVALQCIHHWTAQKLPCALVSEEMSALALGKRTVHFVSEISPEYWHDLSDQVKAEVDDYAATHADCLVLEGCGGVDVVTRSIEKAVRDFGVRCVVVDYAQLLRGSGKGRYEQMTNVSIALRQLASSQKIILLALCQMSRSIESRSEFKPTMADIRESGQYEQDADVIIAQCWPVKLDPTQPPNKFQFFIVKNRNRPINQAGVVCRFLPDRQKILESIPEVSEVFRGKQQRTRDF